MNMWRMNQFTSLLGFIIIKDQEVSSIRYAHKKRRIQRVTRTQACHDERYHSCRVFVFY